MSEKYGISTSEVNQAVRQMIKDKYYLSSANYNSLYFYDVNKIPVISLSEYHKNNEINKEEYSLDILNIPEAMQIKIGQGFYNEALTLIGKYKEIIDGKKSALEKVSIKEIKKFYDDNKHLGEIDVVILLIKYLIEHKCPINIINRSYYFFDKTKQSGDDKPEGLWHLNHENKLVKYDASAGQKWFFVGESGARSFSDLDKKSQRIFDAVEKARKRQK
ncbi:MAG: hypothetical protein IKZ49_00340 [Alphaproteobacteria bacterium]|nr:hypothetical protein [Alphaproteobacteria bacterium]